MIKLLVIKIGFWTILFLALVSALIFLRFDILRKIEAIETLQAKIVFRSQITEDLATLRSDINKIEPSIPKLEEFLLKKDQLINFSRDLKIMASQNNVEISSSFSAEDSQGSAANLKGAGISLSVSGSFDNLINFLKALEKSRYSVRLNMLDFNQVGNGSKVNLSGKVFYIEE